MDLANEGLRWVTSYRGGAGQTSMTLATNSSDLWVKGGITAGGDATIAGDVSVSGTAATWSSGTGTPEGIVSAVVGSMYTRTDGGVGSTLYVKESGSGNTGWAAK